MNNWMDPAPVTEGAGFPEKRVSPAMSPQLGTFQSRAENRPGNIAENAISPGCVFALLDQNECNFVRDSDLSRKVTAGEC